MKWLEAKKEKKPNHASSLNFMVLYQLIPSILVSLFLGKKQKIKIKRHSKKERS